MKKSFIRTGFAVMIAAITLTSCEKNENDATPQSQSEQRISLQDVFSNPQVAAAYTRLKTEFDQTHQNNRAEFITPFFTSDGFMLAKDIVLDFSGPFPVVVSGELAFFGAELAGSDFYRQNNDGTISVHINSNEAFAEHFDFGTGLSSSSNSGHMSMNYNGTEEEIVFVDPDGNVVFVLHIVDIFQNNSAVSFQGNAQVKENGDGAAHLLKSKWVSTPGGNQSHIEFKFN